MPKKNVVIEMHGPAVEAGLRALEQDFPGIRDDFDSLLGLIEGNPGFGYRFIDLDKTYHEDKRWTRIQSRTWPQNDNAGVFVYIVTQDKLAWSFRPMFVCSGARWQPEGEAEARTLLGLPVE